MKVFSAGVIVAAVLMSRSTWAAEVSATRPAAVTLALKSGETIKGRFLQRDSTQVVVSSDLLGAVTVPVTQIESIDGLPYVNTSNAPVSKATATASAAPTVTTPAAAPAEAPASKPAKWVDRFLPNWNKSIDLGLTGQNAGQTDSLSINAGATLATRDDVTDHRTNFAVRYFYTNSDGTRSQNAARATARHDQYIKRVSEHFFVFGNAQYDFDEFQAFRNRISAYAGPGYDFIKREKYTLSGRVGLGFTDDFGDAQTEDFRVEASLGVDGKWTIEKDRQAVTYSIYYYPSLEDFDDGRLVTNLAYEAAIDAAKGIALKLFFEHKYELRTRNETDPTTWRYGANVVMKF